MVEKRIMLYLSYYSDNEDDECEETDHDLYVVESVEAAATLVQKKMKELGDRFCYASVCVEAKAPYGWVEVSEDFETEYWWDEDGTLSIGFDGVKGMIEMIMDPDYIL